MTDLTITTTSLAPVATPPKAISKLPSKVPMGGSFKSKAPSKMPSKVPSTVSANTGAAVPPPRPQSSSTNSAPSKAPSKAGVAAAARVSTVPTKSVAEVPASPLKLPVKSAPTRAVKPTPRSRTTESGDSGASSAASTPRHSTYFDSSPAAADATPLALDTATDDDANNKLNPNNDSRSSAVSSQFLGVSQHDRPLDPSSLESHPAHASKSSRQQKGHEKVETEKEEPEQEQLKQSRLPTEPQVSSTTAPTRTRDWNLEQQLVHAEQQIGKLTHDKENLYKALCETHGPTFVQRTFQLEDEVDWLRRALATEREHTRHHRDAHMDAMVEIGTLREAMNRYGTHDSLMRRNAELEARLSDMARERVEQDLSMAQLREENTETLGSTHGNCGFGSGYVTVRLSALCGQCREKIQRESDRRLARGRLAQLTEPMQKGVVPPPLSQPWPAELVRSLQHGRHEDALLLHQTANSKSTTETRHVKNAGGLQSAVMESSTALAVHPDANTHVSKVVAATPNRLASMSSVWRELQAVDGSKIYYNVLTNASTFERPLALRSP